MFKGVASRALGVFALFTIVCGLGYTLVVTGIAQVAFPYQANGSLIKVDDKIVGSELIGQNFEDEDHMWGRIQNVSVVEDENGELMAYSAPSNLSPASEEYQELVDARVEKIRAANPDAAEYQVPRLAKATGKSEDEVRDIIAQCSKGRFLGVFGEPTVNVLKVNLMLDGAL